MLKDFSKIIDSISKLNDYIVLRKDKKSAVIGTKVTFDRVSEEQHTFQRVKLRKEVEIDTFFIFSVSDESCSFEKSFKNLTLPILVLNKEEEVRPLENLKKSFDDFMEEQTVKLKWKQVGHCL